MGNCIGSARREELEAARARHANLEKEHAAAQHEVKQRKTHADAVESENAQLKQQNEHLQRRCEALEAEYQKRLVERDAQIHKSDEALRAHQQALDTMSHERDAAEERVQQLAVSVLELQKQESAVAKALELARADADALTASTVTKDEMQKLRDDLVHDSQRNMAELLERMNVIQKTGRDELAQARATALVESTAAKEAGRALTELKESTARQHEDDGLKLAATLRKLSACELEFDDTLAKYKTAQATLAASEARMVSLSEELETTKAALANTNAGCSFNTSDVDWTERDYHDRPYKFSHRTTRKDFTISYKWWQASNDYCIDIREWYWNSARGQMERTTKGVFLPLQSAQGLSRVLPEVIRQAKVDQARSPKGSTNS